MTPRVEKIYNELYYQGLDEYEIKQLIVGLVGMTLTGMSFDDAVSTVQSYKMDDELELDFEEVSNA